MQLTFLGSGPAEAIPRAGHQDTLCQAARRPNSKSRRSRSSALLKHQGKNILIDVSPDFLKQAQKARLRRIDTILLTHAHSDATGGLKDLDQWMKKVKHGPIQLYAYSSTISHIKNKIPKIITPIAVRPFRKIDVTGNKVTCIPVFHGINDIATFGFLLGRELFFASDMAGMDKRAQRLLHGVKTLIIDGAFWNKKMLKGHFTAPEAIAFAKKIKPKRLIITQSGHSYPPHEQAQRQINKIAKKQKCAFPAQLAYDGLKINI